MVAGFFARNTETGRVYLFHTGRVGGGAEGVSKEAFLAWSGLTPTTVVDSQGRARDGIVVMPVEGAGATRSLVSYVQQVIEFKKAVRDDTPPSPDAKTRAKLLRDYFREASGRRRGKRMSTEIDYLSRHGEVVEALADWRKAIGLSKGEKLAKNVLIDLGVKKDAKLTEADRSLRSKDERHTERCVHRNRTTGRPFDWQRLSTRNGTSCRRTPRGIWLMVSHEAASN